MKQIIALIFALLLLGGCSVKGLFYGKSAEAITESDIEYPRTRTPGEFLGSIFGGGPYQTLSTKAERRLVIFGNRPLMVCAEPSPDLGESVTASLSLLLGKGLVPKGSTPTLHITNAYATAIEKIFDRSQGVQFYRDSIFALCQARMNGAIGKADFKEMMDEAAKRAERMIEKELECDCCKKSDCTCCGKKPTCHCCKEKSDCHCCGNGSDGKGKSNGERTGKPKSNQEDT